MSTIESIDSFISFFKNQADLVASIQGGSEASGAASDPQIRVAIHKKILYCAILDSLAGIRCSGKKFSNHDRFICFVCQHSDWPEGEMISVPILYERLNSNSSLKHHLFTKIQGHDPNAGNTDPCSIFDEPKHVLWRLAVDGSERKMINQSRHYELLYKYRNFIVHEFREPGYGADVLAPDASEPRYHAHLTDPTWRLLYPEGFLSKLVHSALDSLHSYFVSQNIDPYTRIKDSSKWFSLRW